MRRWSSWSVDTGYTWSGGSASSKDAWNPVCGDGKKIVGKEAWEDGNTTSGDGWSSTWTIETGYTWSGGSISSLDTWYPIWGDGLIISSETWDDWNSIGSDGCSSTWIIEAGYTCSRSGNWSVCGPVCGDGKKVVGKEACEDGNTTSGDGWSSTWTVETGYAWSGGTISSLDTWSPICDDGLIISPEVWDDKNSLSNDGCSNTCQVETGFAWTRDESNSYSICKAIWGDGKKVTYYEECEDGNTTDGDGWNSTCHVESGYSWLGGTISSVDIWSPVCGDGKKLSAEKWDDSNLNNGDGWSKTWTIELGFKWTSGSPINKDIWEEICGDGIVINDTETNCDDGNTINGDGWNSTCQVETGWTWSGGSTKSPDTCKTTWGDGIIAVGIEQWDDKNTKNIDGCSSSCLFEDGFKWTNDYSAAISTVWYEIWGDGKNYGVNPWDDGNNLNGDGCSNSWVVETGYNCGGGSSTMRDTWTEIWGDGKDYGVNECDDGNLINGDGWSSTCEFETWYQWVGGSPTSIDTWSLLYITPSITSISIDNTITISFNGVMNQTSITLKDLQVTIDSYYVIDYSWSATYTDSQTLKLSIKSKTVLEGGEKITIKFTSYKTFRAPRGGWLTVQELSTKLYSNLLTSTESATSLSWFAQYTAYLGIVVTVILLVVGGGSMEMIWALLNTMQIISYLPLMTDYFPEHVRVMYLILKFTNLNFGFMTDIFKKMIFFNVSNPVPHSSLFSKNGFNSSLFILNCGSILLTLILHFFYFILALICLKVSWFRIVKRIAQYTVNLFLFNYILRFMTEGYLEVWFGAILNIYAFENNSTIV